MTINNLVMNKLLNRPISFLTLVIVMLICSCSDRLCSTYSRVSKEHFNNIINSNKVQGYVDQPYTDRYKASMHRKYLRNRY